MATNGVTMITIDCSTLKTLFKEDKHNKDFPNPVGRIATKTITIL